jgi:hypothetical protein
MSTPFGGRGSGKCLQAGWGIRVGKDGGGFLAGDAGRGKALRIIFLDEFNDSFTDVTAQVEGVAGTGRAHQCPDFDSPFAGIRHLQNIDTLIPERIVLQQAGQLGSHRL